MIPYMVGKLASNSSYLTRVLVKYVSGRGYFRAVSSQNWVKFVTFPPPSIVERVGYEVTSALPGRPAVPDLIVHGHVILATHLLFKIYLFVMSTFYAFLRR